MGLYKLCDCAKSDSCPHKWHAQSRGVRMSLEKWAKKPIKNKTEAKEAFALFEAAVLGGTAHQGPKNGHYTISNLLDDYRDLYFLPKGRNYESSEKWRFEVIRSRFGNVKPEDLQTVDVTRWLLELQATRKVGPPALRRYVARLKAIMRWGFNQSLFPVVKVKWGGLSLESEGSGRARRLEPGEEERLKAGAVPWLRQLIEVALDTGLRQGALLKLKKEMFRGTTLVVPRHLLKNKHASHELVIPLTARSKGILEFRVAGLPAGGFIFASPKGAARKGFRKAWMRAVLSSAGLVMRMGNKKVSAAAAAKWNQEQFKKIDLHWHDLRGEFATRLHEAGVAIETISYLLDHSTIEMTRRYIKLRTRSNKPAEAIQALEQFHALFAQAPTAPSSERVM
jgi:integrase